MSYHPPTPERIEAQARKVRKARNLSNSDALDYVARSYGFKDYAEFLQLQPWKV